MSNRLRFGRFEFDPRTLELSRDDGTVPLAPQPARVLAYLLENAGRLLLRDEIQDEIWPGVDSRVTRDQGLNTCIRQIRRALGEDARTPVYIETHPRRGYRFVAPVESAPAEDDPVERPAAAARARRPLSLPGAAAVASVLLLGIGALGLWLARLSPPPARPDATVRLAVLPFEDLSVDRSSEAFALGLTEELTTRLASLDPEGLEVVAHASANRLVGSGDDVLDAARRVGGDFVLEGGVRVEGDRFRLSARLVRAEDGAHVWADQFEDEFGSILDLQETLGARISASILPRLRPGAAGGVARRDEPSAAARRPYLEGLHFLGWETAEGARRAVSRLREAVRLDPGFAVGHAALAEALFWSGSRDEAERSTREALRLRPRLPEAHLVLAEVLLDRDFAFAAARRHFERAVELAPGRPEFRHAYAHYLTVLGRHGDALKELERALELDPLSPALGGDAGWHHYWAGRYEEAAGRCIATAELLQGVPRARAERCVLHSLVRLGRHDEARVHALRIMELAGADATALREIRAARAPEALAAYAAWSVRPANRAVALGADSPYALARAFADLGEKERAMAALEQAVRTRPRGFLTLGVEPRFHELRTDPRFERLLSRIGFPEGRPDLARADGRSTRG